MLKLAPDRFDPRIKIRWPAGFFLSFSHKSRVHACLTNHGGHKCNDRMYGISSVIRRLEKGSIGRIITKSIHFNFMIPYASVPPQD